MLSIKSEVAVGINDCRGEARFRGASRVIGLCPQSHRFDYQGFYLAVDFYGAANDNCVGVGMVSATLVLFSSDYLSKLCSSAGASGFSAGKVEVMTRDELRDKRGYLMKASPAEISES